MMVKDGTRHVQNDVSTLRSSSDECVRVACMQAIHTDWRRKVLETACIQYRQSVCSLNDVRLWCALSEREPKRPGSSLQGAKSVACLSNSSLFFWVVHPGSSIAWMLRSLREWLALVKWAATGFSVRLCNMSFLCPFRRIWRGLRVSPTYCLWHFLHSIR